MSQVLSPAKALLSHCKRPPGPRRARWFDQRPVGIEGGQQSKDCPTRTYVFLARLRVDMLEGMFAW